MRLLNLELHARNAEIPAFVETSIVTLTQLHGLFVFYVVST